MEQLADLPRQRRGRDRDAKTLLGDGAAFDAIETGKEHPRLRDPHYVRRRMR